MYIKHLLYFKILSFNFNDQVERGEDKLQKWQLKSQM